MVKHTQTISLRKNCPRRQTSYKVKDLTKQDNCLFFVEYVNSIVSEFMFAENDVLLPFVADFLFVW